MIRRLAVLLFGLYVACAPALAQQVPHPVDMSQFGHGTILVFPSPTWAQTATDTKSWIVVTPFGVPFTCVTTQTQCFKEVLQTADTYGLSVNYYCQGENRLHPGGGPPFGDSSVFPYIVANAAVDTGAMAQRSIKSFGCNITFTSAPVHGAGAFIINTMLDGAVFNWEGQIVGTDDAPDDNTFVVGIVPSACPATEGCTGKVVQDSEIYIHAVVQGSTSPPVGYVAHGAVVGVSAASGGINEPNIEIGEVNGCGPCTGARSQYGVKIFAATATTGFVGGRLHVKRVHNVVHGILDGDATNPTNYARHSIVLDQCALASTTGVCVDEFGYSNRITVQDANTNNGAAFSLAVKFESTANFNSADIMSTVGETTAPGITDAGAGNSFKRNGMILQEWKGSQTLNMAGVQYNYQPIGSITGGMAVNNPTNSEGVFSTPAGSTVTLNFSPAWKRSPGVCTFSSPGNGQTLLVTTADASHVVATSNTAMTAGIQVAYHCHGAW